MEDPYVYQLSQVKWQFFGTLTFKSGRLPERVRLSMYFAMMRKVCKQFRIHFKRSIWCLRLEQGEMLGRWHFHFLLTGLPGQTVTMSTCFFILNSLLSAASECSFSLHSLFSAASSFSFIFHCSLFQVPRLSFC